MKPRATTFKKIIRFAATCFILIAFNSNSITAQINKLRPTVYNTFIKTGTAVKVQTVEGQRIAHTDTTAVNNIRLDAGKRSIWQYEKRIAVLDKASMQKFRESSKTDALNEDVKVIPELHIEPTNELTESDPTTYRIAFTSQQPLLYDDKLKQFSSKLAFLLINQSGNNNAPIEPIKIEVNSDELSSIKPGSFQIDHLSIPSYNVELVGSHLKDSAKVKVSTVSNPEGYTTYLKVSPSLDINSNRTTIQGLGIQEIPITVSFIGSGSPDSVKVTFTIEKGTVTPNPLMMRYNESATVHVRSEGMGKSKLTATTNSIPSKTIDLNFIFPIYFLLATILGGLAGSFIKNYSKSGKKKITAKIILVGVVTGIVGAAAYFVLGINLLGFSFTAGFNEIAVFAISALFAFFGISIVKPGNDE